MSFAENIKKLRKDNNLSQEELAEMLDVSRQAVSKWEQGTGYPEVEKLLLISNKLNISLDELMSNEVQNKPAETTQNRGFIIITSPHENIIPIAIKWCHPKNIKEVKSLRNTRCLAWTEAARLSLGSQLHFWDGMQIKSKFQRKLKKFIMQFSRGHRFIH